MNRVIKFRAWDKNEKKMHEVQSIDFLARHVSINPYLCSYTLGYIPLMQYSEVHDMHDDVIGFFEGDILEYYENTRNGFVRRVILIEDIRHVPDLSCSKDVRVIGNKYENADMLRVEGIA